MDVPPPIVQRPRRLRRNHRAVTMPAGLLLFVCLFLPGYSECGRSEITETASNPYFVGIGVVGLLVAVASWLLAGRSGELFAAIAGIVASAVALLMTAFYIVFKYGLVGMYLTSAGAVGLLCGSIVWVTEAGDRQRHAERSYAILAVGVAILVIYLAVGLISPFEEPADYWRH